MGGGLETAGARDAVQNAREREARPSRAAGTMAQVELAGAPTRGRAQ